jgi:GTP cyclohydrolase I
MPSKESLQVKVRRISHQEVDEAAFEVASQIVHLDAKYRGHRSLKVYPIPRGGVPAWYAVKARLNQFNSGVPFPILTTDDPQLADVFIDDLVDSGGTKKRYCMHNPDAEFFALFTKREYPNPPPGIFVSSKEWLIFPWEGSEEKSIDDSFVRLLQYIGEDPARGGLLETPTRMAKSWKFWCSGYGREAKDIIKTFDDGAEEYDEMIHVKDIPFYSQCEHHLAPFFGTVTFAYVPDKRIVGLSKMSRLVDVFARRLQVQERLTTQIINAFDEVMHPLGSAITIKARHLCMESRGICQQGSVTTTSALRGVIREQPAARSEFFSLANGH